MLKLNRAQREAAQASVQARLSEYMLRGQFRDSYLHFTLDASKTHGLHGSSLAHRHREGGTDEKDALESVAPDSNSLLRLTKDSKVALQSRFKRLDLSEVQENFYLTVDPSLKQKPNRGGRKRSSSKDGRAGHKGGDRAKRSRFNSVGSNGRSDDELHSLAVNKQVKLEQVLNSALESLRTCKFRPNLFKHLPYENPFCQRLDHGVVPEDYFSVVSEPCDLERVADRVKMSNYTSIEAFENDIRLIISNSRKYNNPKTTLYKLTTQFEKHAATVLKKARRSLE